VEVAQQILKKVKKQQQGQVEQQLLVLAVLKLKEVQIVIVQKLIMMLK
jgi:hypothetical protein